MLKSQLGRVIRFLLRVPKPKILRITLRKKKKKKQTREATYQTKFSTLTPPKKKTKTMIQINPIKAVADQANTATQAKDALKAVPSKSNPIQPNRSTRKKRHQTKP
jgi:hypothetical protein